MYVYPVRLEIICLHHHFLIICLLIYSFYTHLASSGEHCEMCIEWWSLVKSQLTAWHNQELRNSLQFLR